MARTVQTARKSSGIGLAQNRPRRQQPVAPVYVTPRPIKQQPKAKKVPVSSAKKGVKRVNSTEGSADLKRVKLSRSATLDITANNVPSLKRTRTSLSSAVPNLTRHASSVVKSIRKRAIKLTRKRPTTKAKPATTATKKSAAKTSAAKVKKAKAPKLVRSRKVAQLTPRPNLPTYDKELTFESKEVVPFTSVESYSKLGIRAVLLNNEALLKRLINDTKSVSSVHVSRSLNIDRDPLTYALLNENLKLLDLLITDQRTPKPNRVRPLVSLLSKQGTGAANFVMLGHATRAISMTRGAKEGNNAFTKNPNNRVDWRNRIKLALQEGVDVSTIQHVINSGCAHTNYVSTQIVEAIRYGHRKLAGNLIDLYGTHGFNELHKQVLLNDRQPLQPFKAISVKKKGLDNKDVTPLHCACINPNDHYLRELVAIEPDINHPDKDNLRASHYVAACEGTKPLEFLLSKGISPYDVDKQGNLPLHIAAKAGRADNIRLLCEFIKKSDAQVTCINQKNRQSFSPLHIAAMKGHTEAAKMLLKMGANVDIQTGASKFHITPLILACQHGHLDMVKVLVAGGAQVDKRDKLKRTALTHAVIDGNSHIVAYLLQLGADPDVADNSGNSIVHYAAAYGWHFCLKMLIDVEAKVNVFNDWKLTPLGVAYMKGHMGLADLLLKQPGIDVNSQDENGMTLVALTLAGSGVVSPSTLEQLNYLIVDKKADCTIRDSHGNNALHALAASQPPKLENSGWGELTTAELVEERVKLQLEIGQLLLDNNCEPNDLNDDKLSPCMIAAQRGNLALANFLVKKGGRVTTEGRDSEYQSTILHHLVAGDTGTHGQELLESLNRIQPEEVGKMLQMYDEKRLTPFLLANSDISIGNWAVRKKLISAILKIYPDAMWQQSLEKKKPIEQPKGEKKNPSDDEEKSENNEETEDAENEEEEESEQSEDENEANEGENVEYVKGPSAFHLASRFVLAVEKSDQNPIEFLLAECKKYPKVMRKGSDYCLDLQDENGQTSLYASIAESHELAAFELVTAGSNVNFCGSYNDGKKVEDRVENVSCLMRAVKLGLTKIAGLLITAGADVTIADSSGKTALHYGATSNDYNMIDIVEKLIKAGAKVDVPDTKLRTPLHYAINADTGSTDMSTEVIQLLIGNGADMLAKDIRGRTPLHYAFVKIGRHQDCSAMDPIGICSLLLKDAKDVRMDMFAGPDEFGSTPLHYAAMRGANISCMTLMNHHCDLNTPNKQGNTPLGLAVLWKQLSCALALIQGGADINIPIKETSKAGRKVYHSDSDYDKQNKWVWTPLKDVRTKVDSISIPAGIIRNDWQGVVFIMIDQFEKEQKSFFILLQAAVEYRKYNLALMLIRMVKSKRMKITKDDPTQENLIFTLAKTAQPGDNEQLQVIVAKELLDLGTDMVDKKNPTCPHAALLAAECRNLRLLEFFADQIGWENLAKLRQPDGHTVVTKLLKDSYTDEVEKFVVKLRDKHNVSLDTVAEYRVYLDQSAFLEQQSDLKSLPDPVKLTPLINAVMTGNLKMTKFLMQLGVNPDVPCPLGITPLMYAARINSLVMAGILLNSDFVVDDKALRYATETEEAEKSEQSDDEEEENSDDAESEDSDYQRPPKKAKNYARGRQFATAKVPKNNRPTKPGTILNKAADKKSYPADMFKVNTKVNLSARDNQGKSVLHHWVCPLKLSSWANLDLLEYFIAIKMPLDLKDKQGKTPLDYAKDLGYVHIYNRLREELKLNMKLPQANFTSDVEFQPTQVLKPPGNFRDEANIYLDKQAKIIDAKRPKERDLKPHNLSGHRDNGVLVVDEDLDLPYDVLLNKVDVKRGMWGFYNFYRLQLIKRKGSELFVLFTNWGRIGDKGQYQKTPFKDLPCALKEFKSVFASKSGNQWSNIRNFTEIPNKYRLIDVEEVKRPQLPEIDINLKSTVKCRLPNDLQSLIADISDVKMLQKNSRNVSGHANYSVLLPFGLIKRPTIIKAREILLDISEVLEEIQKLAEKPVTKDTIQEKQILLQKCADLSNEFYHCLPFSGYSDCQLEVIDDNGKWENFLKTIDNMLDMEQAASVVAAAAHNSTKIHPYDYIYSCLNIQITLMDPNDEITQYLLSYIANSSSKVKVNVKAIFRLCSPGQNVEFDKAKRMENHQLLWHGTAATNLLSILSLGLLAAPPSAVHTGHLFGKGIYTADIFAKSYNYCTQSPSQKKYALLCEVALGKVKTLDIHQQPNPMKPLEDGYDSLLARGQELPDPRKTVAFGTGTQIPLGPMVKRWNKDLTTSPYVYLNYNEFIVYRKEQIITRYLVVFE